MLAIVIPAYKPHYLGYALESVASQTDRRFRLYVGDDSGPDEIAGQCAAYGASGKDITYHRLHRNLGSTSLAAQWNRCIALSNEPWIWLFSDDDVMTPGCVAAFYDEVGDTAAVDVLRFNTEVIDTQGLPVSTNPRHPPLETGAEFIHERLLGRRQGYVVEYIFRREAFDAAGGFPEYPMAWGSDYAAWYLFSRRGGIRTLRGGGVKYRASTQSISGSARRYQQEKLDATVRFLEFVEREVAVSDAGGRSSEAWRRATENWFLGTVHHLLPVGPSLWAAMLRASRAWWRRGLCGRLLSLSLWNARAWIRLLRAGLAERHRSDTTTG
jgi:glycosyltransferase involved in cell wall biosynthesis